MVYPGRVFEKYGMMHLEAVCLGYAVPRHYFDAEVHSAFTSAANLHLMRDGQLLTLVAAEEADLPQGIRLNTPQGFSFEGLRTKQKVTCRDGILRCEHDPLTIDLRMARQWKCNLIALATNMNDPATSAAWKLVEQVLEGWHARAEIGLPMGQNNAAHRMNESVSNLVASTRQCDLAAAVRAVETLIGLGSGLTPAGDDFLVGYLAGLWCTTSESTKHIRFLAEFGKAVVHLSCRTNDISRTYLVYAAQGQVSSRLTDLAEAICRGEDSDRLLKTAKAAIQVGHDSGIKVVTGLLQGLSAWERDHTQILLVS